MKLAVPALIALALLTGNTGCCLFQCGRGYACSACDAYPDDCGGCDDIGCDGGCGLCHGGCSGMGCGPLHWILNWARCRDCCDQCGNWTGPDIVSHNRPPAIIEEGPTPAAYDEEPQEISAGRVVPGSVRVTTRPADVETEAVVQSDGPAKTVRRSAPSSTRRRPRRISSSPMQSR